LGGGSGGVSSGGGKHAASVPHMVHIVNPAFLNTTELGGTSWSPTAVDLPICVAAAQPPASAAGLTPPAMASSPCLSQFLADRSNKVSEEGGKQAASEPQRVRVGQIDCVEGSLSPKSAPPKLLWGDREDEESLPSLPPPFLPKSSLSSDSPSLLASSQGSLSTDATQFSPRSPCSPAAAEVFPVFPAAAETWDVRDCFVATATPSPVVGFPVPAVGTATMLNGMSQAVLGVVPPSSDMEGLNSNVFSEHHHEGIHLAPILENSSNLSQFDHGSKCVKSHHFSDRLIVGIGAFLGGRYSKQALINFGGIPEANSNVRTSKRIRSQFNVDDTQMDRAKHLAEIKNIGSYQGTDAHSNFFLHSISNDYIIARTVKLGVSLGNLNSKVAQTIKDIKNCDTSRTLIMLSKNIDENACAVVDTNLPTLDHSRLLSNDLSEDEVEMDEDILNLTLAEIKKIENFKRHFGLNQLWFVGVLG
jgi:hypothetical protein